MERGWAKVAVAMPLVDKPKRRDHAIPGAIVGREHLQPAARPQTLDPPVARFNFGIDCRE